MAKSTKGGLGRGIDSLLGSYEEPKPEPTTYASRTAERVAVDADDSHPEDNITIKGIVEREAAPQPQPERVAQAPRAAQRAASSVSGEQLGDGASIVDIVERATDEVPIDCVSPNPDQPRTNFKREELEELAASIEEHGLIQPILVRSVGNNRYQIIAGERRWQACKLAGLKNVPIRTREVDDDKALELAMIENIQRSDLNPIEEAYGYRRLMERLKMTQAEVARAVSKGRSTVANALRLLDLPEQAQQLLFEEKITAGHARAILSVPTAEGREKLTQKLLQEHLSVRETEAIARLMAGRKDAAAAAPRPPMPKVYKSVAKSLRKSLGTNVRISSAKGKNRIEIEFKDEEDLKRLFDELSSSSL